MSVGEVDQRRDDPLSRPRGTEVCAGDQRLAGTGSQRAGADGISPGRGQGRAGAGRALATGPAAGGQQRARAEDHRFSPGDPAHDAPSPAITLSRVVWRVTHTIATSPASASPARTSAISVPVALSDSVT